MKITESTTLTPDRHVRTRNQDPSDPIIEIAADGVALDMAGAVLDG